MKRLSTIFRAAACVLSLLAGPSIHARTPDPAMHTALGRLVTSQNLDQNWPLLARSIGSAGPRKIIDSASKAIDAKAGLSPEQRSRAKQSIEGLAPQIATDLDAMLMKVDAKGLMLDMVETVYPKYFSLREIQEMTTFYESPAFRKVTSMGIQAQGEIARTGQNPALVWARYEARLTPEEKRQLAAFQTSPTGKKLTRTGPQVKEESLRYMQARTDGMLEELVARYRDQIENAVSVPKD